MARTHAKKKKKKKLYDCRQKNGKASKYSTISSSDLHPKSEAYFYFLLQHNSLQLLHDFLPPINRPCALSKKFVTTRSLSFFSGRVLCHWTRMNVMSCLRNPKNLIIFTSFAPSPDFSRIRNSRVKSLAPPRNPAFV